eukprot:31190-Pelagococcus_subviridis.AAC.10
MNLIEIERRRESRSRIVVVVARYVRAQANACSRTRAARTAFTPPTGSPFAAQYSFNSAAVSVSSSPLSANPFTSVAANPAAAASRPPPIAAALRFVPPPAPPPLLAPLAPPGPPPSAATSSSCRGPYTASLNARMSSAMPSISSNAAASGGVVLSSPFSVSASHGLSNAWSSSAR